MCLQNCVNIGRHLKYFLSVQFPIIPQLYFTNLFYECIIYVKFFGLFLGWSLKRVSVSPSSGNITLDYHLLILSAWCQDWTSKESKRIREAPRKTRCGFCNSIFHRFEPEFYIWTISDYRLFKIGIQIYLSHPFYSDALLEKNRWSF